VGLSFAALIVMHQMLLDRYGGMPGITEQGFGKLDAALAAPDLSIFGEDLYPDIASKASILFWGLVRAHALTDGNKRVALVALLDMLERHGLRIAATHDELFDFVMAASSDMPGDAVRTWIAERLVPEHV
jgi:death-on-curing protein